MKNFNLLQKKLGIKFKNIDLLKQACVHRSYLNEHPKFHLNHNERLEFLGDAVLELVTTEYLYQNYPNPEGELTNWRSALVNSAMLSKKAKKIGLNKFLYLSKGERKDVGKARELILANTFEALIGAIYLDRGYNLAKKFIKKILLSELSRILKYGLYQDPKSKLQEAAQEKFRITPSYKIIKEWGPDHERKFIIGVYIDKKLVGKGFGKSKQEAQVKAAKDALKDNKWQRI